MTLVYKKIHLFDIDLNGEKPIRESDTFGAGEKTSVIDFLGYKIGNSICYDLRFAELYSIYAKQEVDIILVPAAFLVKTGEAHWESLLRARAIESQCYVIAAAQVGEHKSFSCEHLRRTYGHSMIVDPWGKVVALKPKDEGLFYYEINLSEVKKVREQIPMKQHRRIDF